MPLMTEKHWTARRERWHKRSDDDRGAYDVDYARVIHSASFRRLQGKTQVFNLGESDFYRTRLTHSLEVSQIAMSIVKQLERKCGSSRNSNNLGKEYLPPLKLIATIGLAHDLGHPPFGHRGEIALNYCMVGHGGFEGNGQTLRILAKLENFTEEYGSNLTRRTLLGCLKYPVGFSIAKGNTVAFWKAKHLSKKTLPFLIDTGYFKPPKCYLDTEQEIVDWILFPLSNNDKTKFQSGKYRSFDCSIMNLADDISYAVHDLEDGLALNLIEREKFNKIECSFEHFLKTSRREGEEKKEEWDYKYLIDHLFGRDRKKYIGRLIHYFVTNLEIDKKIFDEPLLKYQVKLNKSAEPLLDALKDVVKEEVINSPNVQQLELKGQRMVIEVFEMLSSDPKKLLPLDFRERLTNVRYGGKERVICDYIAGMTDSYLHKTYERLSKPGMGSVFDRL